MYNENKGKKHSFVSSSKNYVKNWTKGLKPKKIKPDARGKKIIWKEK